MGCFHILENTWLYWLVERMCDFLCLLLLFSPFVRGKEMRRVVCIFFLGGKGFALTLIVVCRTQTVLQPYGERSEEHQFLPNLSLTPKILETLGPNGFSNSV